MRETALRGGRVLLTADDDDDDQFIVEPVIREFSPVGDHMHCVCGAPLKSWSVRPIGRGRAELACLRCHSVLAGLGLAVRTSR